MILQKHNEEKYYLKRRIELLKILDHCIYSGMSLDEIASGDEMQSILREFYEVMYPADLIARLEEVYPDERSAGESEKRQSAGDNDSDASPQPPSDTKH